MLDEENCRLKHLPADKELEIDALTSGRALILLMALDDASRECLDLISWTALLSEKFTGHLDAVALFLEYSKFKIQGVLTVRILIMMV